MDFFIISLILCNIVFTLWLLRYIKSKDTGSLDMSKIDDGVDELKATFQNNQTAVNQQMLSVQSEILKSQGASSDKIKDAVFDFSNNISERVNQMEKDVVVTLNNNLTALGKINEENNLKTAQFQHDYSSKIQNELSNFSESSNHRLYEMELNIVKTLNDNLDSIRKLNERKLTELQSSVNDKLDKSLNERLDTSFSKITDHLSELYKSLGELSKMSSDISNLNRSLANVKVRGTWGEAQLRDIIRETMVNSQYEENIVTKPGSNDPVEFAIKIPSKDNDRDYILLPIDSKFPLDRYNDVINASESGDKQQLLAAIKQLEIRVKEEARKIRDKYIAVPVTTNFAVMYLPTESLYAEVLRINGLAELCQNQYGVIIAGPTTITALLNSLRVGFQNLTLSKKTDEVQKLLVAIKDQFFKMDELIDKAQKKIAAASDANEQLAKRSGMIQKRLAKIGLEIPADERALLPDPGQANIDLD